MKIKNKIAGFTLIEIMIAISIIAIISAVGISSFNQAQIRGRDAKRKQDLRSLAIALELYRQKNGRYPCALNGLGVTSTNPNWIVDSTSCGNGTTVNFDTNYINSIPQDPLTNNYSDSDASTHGYFYNTPGVTTGVGSTCPALPSGATGNPQYFVLRTRLENTNDPDRCELKQNARCDAVIFCNPITQANATYFVITSQ